MEAIKVTRYKAFDGTLFNSPVECEVYEHKQSKAHMINLRNFEIVFPMQDQVTTCRAYFVPCPNAFEMFKTFVTGEYSEFDPTYLEYNGDGWYVLQSDDCGWAQVTKLSEIIHDWGIVLDKIAQKTMDFKEV